MRVSKKGSSVTHGIAILMNEFIILHWRKFDNNVNKRGNRKIQRMETSYD